MNSGNFSKRFEAMREELKSMDDIKVCDLVELPEDSKKVNCKWLFKAKLDSNEAIHVGKGYFQKYGIDYKETFSPMSNKDSLRIVLALMAYYDLEFHQMDVKTASMNGDLEEEVYMDQPRGLLATRK